MSAHTPGPWKALKATVRGETTEWFVTDDEGAAVIASCVTDKTGEPSEANARLIAAAPETAAELDRLREINAELLHAIETLLGETDDSDYMSQAEREAVARAAVAKSKGGAA